MTARPAAPQPATSARRARLVGVSARAPLHPPRTTPPAPRDHAGSWSASSPRPRVSGPPTRPRRKRPSTRLAPRSAARPTRPRRTTRLAHTTRPGPHPQGGLRGARGGRPANSIPLAYSRAPLGIRPWRRAHVTLTWRSPCWHPLPRGGAPRAGGGGGRWWRSARRESISILPRCVAATRRPADGRAAQRIAPWRNRPAMHEILVGHDQRLIRRAR